MNLDFILFEKINQLALKWFWLDVLGIFFAKYLGYILIFCLLFFLLKGFKKYRLMIARAFLAGILARLIIVNFIRWILPRYRPFVENNINLLLEPTSAASFPSGHSAFYFAIATVVYFYNKKIGVLFLLASFLISISRVFVGIHWPSDILAGAVIGIFSGWLGYKIFKRIKFFKTI